MAKEKETRDCCGAGGKNNRGIGATCCEVSAVITIDSRGQAVFPKELRKKAGIKPGDRFAVICIEMNGKFCCMTLVKADELGEMARGMLGPLVVVAGKGKGD
jgi:AbrB family looped-hinge helix DNA binding protein